MSDPDGAHIGNVDLAVGQVHGPWMAPIEDIDRCHDSMAYTPKDADIDYYLQVYGHATPMKRVRARPPWGCSAYAVQGEPASVNSCS